MSCGGAGGTINCNEGPQQTIFKSILLYLYYTQQRFFVFFFSAKWVHPIFADHFQVILLYFYYT